MILLRSALNMPTVQKPPEEPLQSYKWMGDETFTQASELKLMTETWNLSQILTSLTGKGIGQPKVQLKTTGGCFDTWPDLSRNSNFIEICIRNKAWMYFLINRIRAFSDSAHQYCDLLLILKNKHSDQRHISIKLLHKCNWLLNFMNIRNILIHISNPLADTENA